MSESEDKRMVLNYIEFKKPKRNPAKVSNLRPNNILMLCL